MLTSHRRNRSSIQALDSTSGHLNIKTENNQAKRGPNSTSFWDGYNTHSTVLCLNWPQVTCHSIILIQWNLPILLLVSLVY